MATIPIFNAPTSFSMQNFKSISDALGGPAKSCRFAVRIIPQGSQLQSVSNFTQDLVYLCEAAEYPGRGFLNMEARYYGPTMKLPYQSQYEEITLTFICRNASQERRFFDDWQAIINPPTTFDFNYRDDYRSQIDIFHLDEQNVPQYYFTLINAYPVLVNPQQLTWADDQFLRLGVTFTYTYWNRPGIDRGYNSGDSFRNQSNFTFNR